jgi:uncharacterized C2H2 Zn-finger protein
MIYMDKNEERSNVSKVYCDKCDIVFDSQDEFDKHNEKHSGVMASESCPIDTMISKFARLFKK